MFVCLRSIPAEFSGPRSQVKPKNGYDQHKHSMTSKQLDQGLESAMDANQALLQD